MTIKIDLSLILRLGGLLLAGINTIFFKIAILDFIAFPAMIIGVLIFYKNASPTERVTAHSRLIIIGIGAAILLTYLLFRFVF